ncbi:MAG: CpsD/CapB family tyrosine-protein kinase, partial [Anaerolineae bacterium]
APTEGKSLTAANLGVALAQAGRRVVVVDADLHRPRQHRLFGLRNNVGLTSALLEPRPGLEGLLQDGPTPGLRVLTSGPLPPNPAELLGSARMKELLAELAAGADIVLLDSPPATALADATILSTQCDGVLLVLDCGMTRREVARRALEALRRVNARVVGALLNRMPLRGGGSYYYYYYYYYYGHYYSDDGRDGAGGAGRLAGLRRRLGRHREPAAAERPAAKGKT